jgi:CTP:phosphocholine cytidylyltransferase-like protein
MSSYGSRSLLRIGPDYLISKQINTIREVYPKAEIICVLGYESERVYKLIKDYNVKTVFNDNYRDTYSLKSLIYGIRQSNTNRTFIVHGDLCFLPEHIDFDLTYSTALVDYATSKEVTVNIQAGQILQFGYGFNSCWQKIIFFNKKGTDILKGFGLSDTDLKRIDFEIFNYLIDKGIDIKPFQGKTQEINSYREYKCVR